MMTKLRREQPHFRACTRDDVAYGLPTEYYADFMAHWTNGKPFWTGFDLWGQEITIKLAAVICVIRKTADSMAVCEADDEEERQRNLINGDTP